MAMQNEIDVKSGAAAVPMQIDTFPTLAEVGFNGGHGGLVAFAERMFSQPEPRFLRSDDGDLVVFRSADLQAMAAIPEVGNVPPSVMFGPGVADMLSDESVPGSGLARVLSNQVFFANPPIHKQIRKILVSHFGPKQVAQMEPIARSVIGRIFDGLKAGEVVDFVADVADQITLRFWGDLLGMQEPEITELEGHVRGLTNMFYLEMKPGDFQHLDASSAGYLRVIKDAVARTLEAGTHPIVNEMARELAAVDLPDDLDHAGVVPRDLGHMLAGNLVDGYHTAALGAANALHVLAARPAVLEELHQNPEKIMGAIFEALRLEPPVIFLKRWIKDPVTYDGFLIPGGTSVIMMWGAGGFDPAAFPDPFSFDLERSRRGSTVFGGGIHICPGRFVAPMLTKILIETIIERGIMFAAPAEDAPFYPTHIMSQLQRLPLQIMLR